jgi:putative Mn2+ efflux pump MntP
MAVWEILLIASGLSMDAFAVSVTLGLSQKKPLLRMTLLPAVFFGAFQALMPALGYLASVSFVDNIRAIDHWAVFILLSFIGGKMIKDSFSKKPATENTETENPAVVSAVDRSKHGGIALGAPEGLLSDIFRLFLLALATSIDALAVGVTFAIMDVPVVRPALMIGATTFCFTVAGVQIGRIAGAAFKSKAELSGGIVLTAIGLKILLEQTVFAH